MQEQERLGLRQPAARAAMRPIAPTAARSAPSSGGSPPEVPATSGHSGLLQSSALLGSHQAVEIEHNGQRYRLQTTKAGKLILTK